MRCNVVGGNGSKYTGDTARREVVVRCVYGLRDGYRKSWQERMGTRENQDKELSGDKGGAIERRRRAVVGRG